MATTKAQKNIEWRELLNTALTVEGSFGDMFNRFHTYSYMNQVLLVMQGVREPVATYKKWLELGRQVKKGSKAKEILRPIIKKSKDAQGEEHVDYMSFRFARCLFTLGETDGEELPEVQAQDWKLAEACQALDIKMIDFKLMDGNTGGYAIRREIAINPVCKNPLAVSLHEIAHIMLEHTDKTKQAEANRAVQEVQAEATAHILLKELKANDETQDSASRAYIQEWLKGNELADKDIRQIFTAVNKILQAGKPKQ